MDAITNLMRNLENSKDSFLGKDLTTENNFLQKVELSFTEQNFQQKIEFSYYIGKFCMCLSFQAEYFPSHEDVLKLVILTEEYFAREKKLREVGWCANYMMDKRENNDFMTDFVLINYSPNRRIIDDQQPIDNFELCNCYFCKSIFE